MLGWYIHELIAERIGILLCKESGYFLYPYERGFFSYVGTDIIP
jgi:hypothetical protein